MDAAEWGKERDLREVYHGGELAAAALRFPQAPRPWLDLSTGINPIPYPVGDLSPECWMRLPGSTDIRSLEDTAALAYGARDAGMVVAAPGAQALIQWLPHLLTARRVGILGFTYAEHRARWRAGGAKVETVPHLEALDAFDVAVVVNPNNPDGRVVAQRDAARLDALLVAAGFAIEGGTPLFRLARHAGAAGWFTRLGLTGVLARPFAERRHWLRLGLPGLERDWRRLATALGIQERGSAISYPNSAADAASQDQKLPAKERMTDIS
jgi:hypothetical protein